MYSTYFDTCAFQDELNPHDMQCEGFLGMHATAVDSLDTLLLLNLHDEYNRTREYLREHLNFDDVTEPISVFETTIRILGGLNSAYALTGDPLWRSKALELAERFLPAFNETSSGCPQNQALISEKSSDTPNRVQSKIGGIGGSTTSTADVGTLQLEMRSVSMFTGDPRFARAADRCTDSLLRAIDDLSYNRGGLPPPKFDVESGSFFGSEQTVSGLVDSFIEMLLKTWLASGKSPRDEPLIRLFNRIAPHVWKNLVKTSPTGITFVSNRYSARSALNDEMHHLACFYPGSLALAALHGFGGGVSPLTDNLATNSDSLNFSDSHVLFALARDEGPDTKTGNENYLEQARMLGRACREMSRAGEHGIPAEITKYGHSGPVAKRGVDFSWLRPEVVESFFYLDSVDTSAGDRYKEWGRQMWQSLRKHSQVPGGPDGLLGSWKGLRDAKSYTGSKITKRHRERMDRDDGEDDFDIQDDDTAGDKMDGEDEDEDVDEGEDEGKDDIASDRDDGDGDGDGDGTENNMAAAHGHNLPKVMRRRIQAGASKTGGSLSSTLGSQKGERKFLLRPDGKLHSFVIAETLKYFWLLFDERTGDDAPLPLEKWVFNTEAHPVPVVNAFDKHSFPGSLYVPLRN